MAALTRQDRKDIAEILDRRANEIAGFRTDYAKGDPHYGSVELALDREITRLRKLADKVRPAEPE